MRKTVSRKQGAVSSNGSPLTAHRSRKKKIKGAQIVKVSRTPQHIQTGSSQQSAVTAHRSRLTAFGGKP